MIAISTEDIDSLTTLLVEAASPRKILLFGSHARGEAREDSDIDVMVVEAEPEDRHQEMVRLNRLLRRFRLPVDLLVVSEAKFEYWREVPGNVYFEAATEGKLLYEAA